MTGKYALGVLACLGILVCSQLATAGESIRKWSFERPGYGRQTLWATDHVFIQKDGLWHVFYTNAYTPQEPDWSIGHAVSANLRDWEERPDVVAAGLHAPGWRTRYVWAPYVVEWPDGGYVMVFTGVNDQLSQINGFLWSQDLETWEERAEYPPVTPDAGIYYWRADADNDNRDPHLLFSGGLWHLFCSTRTSAGVAAIGHSTSTDLQNWTHHQPLLTVGEPWQSPDLESPGVIEHNGEMILYYSRGGVRILKSSDIDGPWSPDLAWVLDPVGSGAEIYRSGSGLMLSRIRRSSCDMARGVLLCDSLDTSGWPFQRIEPPGLVDFPDIIGDAFNAQPTFGDGPGVRGEASAGHRGLYWLSTRELNSLPRLDEPCGRTRGTVRRGEMSSNPFYLVGDTLSAWVSGGTTSDSLGVVVCDACTGEELARFTPDSETLARQSVPVESFRGRWVQWKIVDWIAGEGGWLGVDDLEESAGDDTGPMPEPPTITWETPTGGELFMVGENIGPNWSVTHPSGVDSAIIFITYDKGRTLREIGRQDDGYPGFLPWPAPDTVAFAARFRLVAYAHDGSKGCLDSEPFNINVTTDVGGLEVGGGLQVWMGSARTYLEGSVPAGTPGGEATLEIFNVLGRRIAIPWRGRTGESFRVPAPTTDADGRRLASGVYFARLRHGGEFWIARFVHFSGR
jgi:hypothetical protein